MSRTNSCVLTIAAALVLVSCEGRDSERGDSKSGGTKAPVTNRIDIPGSVRQNLGMTWAEARQGRLEKVVSVPGEIVARPDRVWDLHAPMAGTLTLIAKPWQTVEAGEIVARIASPALAAIQAELFAERMRAEEARRDLARTRAELEPAKALAQTLATAAIAARDAVTRFEEGHLAAKSVAVAVAERLTEIERLRATDAVSAATLLTARREALEVTRDVNEAEKSLRQARVDASEQALKASTATVVASESNRRLELLETGVSAAEAAFAQRLASLAASSGLTESELLAVEDGVPAWARLRELPLRAASKGVVIAVHAQASTWIDEGGSLLQILDPSTLMFRALLPEADAGALPRILEAVIEAAGSDDGLAAISATLRPVVDPLTRSAMIEALLDNQDGKLLLGSSASARIVMSRATSDEVLVPVICVVRDGLESVVFRRDPANPDKVIRTTVTLGRESGGWVEVIAGVGEGDQLVQDGVRQLGQTGLGKAAAGGHFHADGTWHEGDH